MELTNDELIIKNKVHELYKQIEKANKDIEEIREGCKHEKTKLVNYMWAPGHISPDTKVCAICGIVINDYSLEIQK